jgi:hypothetical protein
MKIDFHYYTIFALLKFLGMTDTNAQIVAYSSQQVDDARYGHTLYFESGGRAVQTMAQHDFLSLKADNKDIMFDVYVPFHYLPALEGDTFEEKLICKPNSKTVQALYAFAEEKLDAEYGLHLLGIILHVIADTYSHNQYSGIESDYNLVSEVRTKRDDYNKVRWFQLNAAKLAPPIGHAYVYDLNDESNMVWSYTNAIGKPITLDNKVVYKKACFEIYAALQSIRDSHAYLFPDKTSSLDQYYETISALYSDYSMIEEREKLWLSTFRNGAFGFKSNQKYSKRDWFKEAVTVKKYNWFERYIAKATYQDSNWKLFQDALKVYKDHLHREVLSKHQIFM